MKNPKDPVKLRQRKMPSGNTSLYLDIYVRGKRSYEYLDIHQFTQLRICEDKDTLNDEDLCGPDLHGLVRAVVDGVIVYGAVNALSRLEGAEMVKHKLGVEGIGMVKVGLLALLEWHVRLVVVVRVLRYHRHRAFGQALYDAFHYGGLSRSCATGYAYDDWRIL